ncbi:MAG: uroporphyrinogen-III synthase [Panacagrimonas sp.]
MKSLAGRRILITRPQGQNSALAKLLRERGAQPVELPLFAIEPHGSTAANAAVLNAARDWTGWLFTSANAVRAAAGLDPGSWAPGWAIGAATARELGALGHPPTTAPEGDHTSEALLAHPALQQLDGTRFLLCTGVGGRDLIETTLRARGAQVQRLDLYRRVPVDHAPDQGRAAVAVVDAIVCTSGEGVQRLYALTPADLRPQLLSRVLVVPSVRVVELARRQGFADAHAAPRASDEDWVNTLALWL